MKLPAGLTMRLRHANCERRIHFNPGFFINSYHKMDTEQENLSTGTLSEATQREDGSNATTKGICCCRFCSLRTLCLIFTVFLICGEIMNIHSGLTHPKDYGWLPAVTSGILMIVNIGGLYGIIRKLPHLIRNIVFANLAVNFVSVASIVVILLVNFMPHHVEQCVTNMEKAEDRSNYSSSENYAYCKKIAFAAVLIIIGGLFILMVANIFFSVIVWLYHRQLKRQQEGYTLV
jgi:uncharacterized membrane protein HdeD (DUF308 family)